MFLMIREKKTYISPRDECLQQFFRVDIATAIFINGIELVSQGLNEKFTDKCATEWLSRNMGVV